MYNPKISVFRSLFNSKETPFTLEAIEVYNRIKQGNPELISKIKKLRAGDSESKMQLMAIMFNGTFSERKDDGLIQHSGLCVLDFDKYPDAKTLKAERNRLKECPYVYMMFTSPSGNGLKVVIRTPESNKFEHKRRFEAYKEYINSDYFDVANSNVSRVCFESYDPDAYLNEFCDVFQGITEDKGYHKAEKIAVLPIANEDRIIELIMKFNHGKFGQGSRNNWIFKVACCMCEYGVDQYAAKNYLLQYAQEDFTAGEINNTVANAYKSSNFNTRYFEDANTVNKVKLKLKEGLKDEDIQKQLGVSSDIIESVKEEVQNSDDVFWQADGKKITIVPHDYAKFLQKHGFAKYYPERSNKPTYVYIEENKVSESSVELIKDFVLKYCLAKGELDVYNHCAKSANLFTESHLNMLESIDMRILQDSRYVSYIPFLNGVAKVSKDKVELMSYIDIDGYIWREQIIKRNYTQIAIHDNNFQDFVHKVSAQDEQRIKAMESTLGYLIHTFKDKTDQKAIIFNDQEIDDNPNGGSGKSLMLTAIVSVK